MKYIIAVVKPHRLEEIRTALTSIGVDGMTVSEVKGFGRQKGHSEVYRGAEYRVDFVPKVKLEIAVEASQAPKVIETIRDADRVAWGNAARRRLTERIHGDEACSMLERERDKASPPA